MTRLFPRTLTTRLVVTVVALVALVGLMVATSATLAMRGYLYDRLDSQVRDGLRGQRGPVSSGPEIPGVPDDDSGRAFLRPGLTVAELPGSDTTVGVTVSRSSEVERLSDDTVAELQAVPSDGQAHTVEVEGTQYRVMTQAEDGHVFVTGQPTTDIDQTVQSMVTWFALLTLLGVGVAGIAGTWLVRRQLRPLNAVAETAREVSTQDLATGGATISTRVDAGLTDPETEVGQVGAALNTLLDHVDSALTARHRSEQQVRQFVADASHELRTPLSTIHGYAELSRRTPDDPAALGAALNKVETEAGRMSGLVEDLLLLARLDAGRPLAREDVDVTRLLLEAVADARVLAPDHHWRLDLLDEPVVLVGDDARLHQVVTNLLNNARSHTPAGTTVTVRARTAGAGPGATVRIEVHDDGPGLGPDLAAEAFDRFSRGDSSRTRASGGAGLGLSLVSAIAAAHGGSATVTSAPGDTRFVVTLPASGRPASAS
ncbi:sensor histidine kinase [Marmoricola sp. RAF53]|uniref:sensor histidine kinase n=1 Tax=Marmoricola sp. RAF53 TaxID=3233059 RepID=UPI003F98F1FC